MFIVQVLDISLGGNSDLLISVSIAVFSVNNVVTEFLSGNVCEIALGTNGWVHNVPISVDGKAGNHNSLFVKEVFGSSNYC